MNIAMIDNNKNVVLYNRGTGLKRTMEIHNCQSCQVSGTTLFSCDKFGTLNIENIRTGEKTSVEQLFDKKIKFEKIKEGYYKDTVLLSDSNGSIHYLNMYPDPYTSSFIVKYKHIDGAYVADTNIFVMIDENNNFVVNRALGRLVVSNYKFVAIISSVSSNYSYCDSIHCVYVKDVENKIYEISFRGCCEDSIKCSYVGENIVSIICQSFKSARQILALTTEGFLLLSENVPFQVPLPLPDTNRYRIYDVPQIKELHKLRQSDEINYLILDFQGNVYIANNICDVIEKLKLKTWDISNIKRLSGATTQVKAYVSKKCVICLDRISTVTFFPCNHRCICTACANVNECPLCRSKIRRFIVG